MKKNESFGRPRWGLIMLLVLSAAAFGILCWASIQQVFPAGLWP